MVSILEPFCFPNCHLDSKLNCHFPFYSHFYPFSSLSLSIRKERRDKDQWREEGGQRKEEEGGRKEEGETRRDEERGMDGGEKWDESRR